MSDSFSSPSKSSRTRAVVPLSPADTAPLSAAQSVQLSLAPVPTPPKVLPFQVHEETQGFMQDTVTLYPTMEKGKNVLRKTRLVALRTVVDTMNAQAQEQQAALQAITNHNVQLGMTEKQINADAHAREKAWVEWGNRTIELFQSHSSDLSARIEALEAELQDKTAIVRRVFHSEDMQSLFRMFGVEQAQAAQSVEGANEAGEQQEEGEPEPEVSRRKEWERDIG